MKFLFTKNYCYLIFCLVLFISGCTPPKPIKGAVVSAREEASAIGVAIMKQGGTAFDAMIATDLALTVCYPNAGNISGGGFFMYRSAAGEVGSLDYREKAPLGASSNMYLEPKNLLNINFDYNYKRNEKNGSRNQSVQIIKYENLEVIRVDK